MYFLPQPRLLKTVIESRKLLRIRRVWCNSNKWVSLSFKRCGSHSL